MLIFCSQKTVHGSISIRALGSLPWLSEPRRILALDRVGPIDRQVDQVSEFYYRAFIIGSNPRLGSRVSVCGSWHHFLGRLEALDLSPARRVSGRFVCRLASRSLGCLFGFGSPHRPRRLRQASATLAWPQPWPRLASLFSGSQSRQLQGLAAWPRPLIVCC